jgi:hypothetical protein
MIRYATRFGVLHAKLRCRRKVLRRQDARLKKLKGTVGREVRLSTDFLRLRASRRGGQDLTLQRPDRQGGGRHRHRIKGESGENRGIGLVRRKRLTSARGGPEKIVHRFYCTTVTVALPEQPKPPI